jgi:hypothetical protein
MMQIFPAIAIELAPRHLPGQAGLVFLAAEADAENHSNDIVVVLVGEELS